MIKYILLAATSMLPIAAAHAQLAISWEDTIKESIDATQFPDMPTSPDGAPTPSDLTLDPAFSADGMFAFSSPRSNGYNDIEVGLRVFPYTTCTGSICSLSGYYVFGREGVTNGGYSAFITRIELNGQRDTTFGSNGWMYPTNTSSWEVVDAAIANDRIYWLTTEDSGGTSVMGINCTLLTTGDACFPSRLITFGASASGPIQSVIAYRVVYDSRYGLFVAGTLRTNARGREIAVARVDATTGLLVNEFHGNGTTIGLPSWAAQTNSDIEVFDMAVVPDGTPGGERLYISGIVKRDAADYDGFVLGLHPNDGYIHTGWAWNAVYYEDDNTGNKFDAVTAITVQRNGKLAIAGWSEAGAFMERPMILGRFNTDGTLDYSFCDGAAICKRNYPWPGVVDHDIPAAIAERAGNRDLVIALQHNRPAASDPRPRQLVVQYSANGNVSHAQRTLDYPAAPGVTPRSSPSGMWVGNINSPPNPGNEVVAVVGMRLWNSEDYDATLTQLMANDSIYADQFGGSNSD